MSTTQTLLIQKTGIFETDVRAGYYRQERDHIDEVVMSNRRDGSTTPVPASTWEEDFRNFLISKGVRVERLDNW